MHLCIPERAGLISRSRQAQRKPCALRVEPLKDAAEWIEQSRAEARWKSRQLPEQGGQGDLECDVDDSMA
jgi:hypothetical protein